MSVTEKAATEKKEWKADLKVLSLGAGIQSSTLLYMAASGEIEADAAVFADTQWEPGRVYEHLEKLKTIAADAGIDLRVATVGNLKERVLHQDGAEGAEGSRHFVTIPLHVTDSKGRPGMIRRVCTHDYKIVPIRRTVRDLMKERGAKTVDQIIGISWDEVQRMRESDVKFIRNVYPLVERRMTRQACMAYIEAGGWPVPAKSACIGCPFHDDAFWRDLKKNAPDEWQDAVEFDHAIRGGGRMSGSKELDGEAFLHRTRQPLDLVDLRTPEEKGQGSLFDVGFEENCDGGVCGV